MAGFWKATGRDKAVYDKSRLIGMRKTLVFYKGRAPNGQKTDWIMHEYRLESDENGPPQAKGWVVCRAFKKRTNGQSKTIEGWESNYFYDEPSGVSSVVDPIDQYVSRQAPPNFLACSQSFLCKQEIEADNLSNFAMRQSSTTTSTDPFVQLPQLESPSLPFIKRPSSVSLISEINEEENDRIIKGRCENMINNNISMEKKVTDWRALDKFVASQLSHDDQDHDGDRCSFGMNGQDLDSAAAFMLLQSSSSSTRDRDQEGNNSKLSAFLNSSSSEDCGFGICIFEK
ncbi:hypothetical protein TIFTF001_002330 [Ficus carica]|uniref:NAC domain-containing protein n=1 Tax=Ficus carica TaxID=3494 RepID=A0AA87Z3E1_FICCA|nr:hypothetical protein TIFTF001_002330 [Ficus carica]